MIKKIFLSLILAIARKTTTRTHKGKTFVPFCAISLQKPVILLSIPKYISPFIILIILTLFVAVFPCLPTTSDF